jgi:hypothetical protein
VSDGAGRSVTVSNWGLAQSSRHRGVSLRVDSVDVESHSALTQLAVESHIALIQCAEDELSQTFKFVGPILATKCLHFLLSLKQKLTPLYQCQRREANNLKNSANAMIYLKGN